MSQENHQDINQHNQDIEDEDFFANEINAFSSIVPIPFLGQSNSEGGQDMLNQIGIYIEGNLEPFSFLSQSQGLLHQLASGPRPQTYFVDSLSGATIKDGRAKLSLGNKDYDVNLLAEYLLYSKYFKCPRNSECFTEEEISLIYDAISCPLLLERLKNCVRLDSSQNLAAKFFTEISATIIFQILSTCELTSINSLELLQASMEILWGNFIQSLSALLLYDPLQAALSSLDLKTEVEQAYSNSTQNPEDVYIYEPLALEPLKRSSNDLCAILTSSVLKLNTMDAIAKIQTLKIKIMF